MNKKDLPSIAKQRLVAKVSYHRLWLIANKGGRKGERTHMRYTQVSAKNRPSPWNEDAYIEAYKKAVPSATNNDNYDIAAVISISGIYGHALMHQSYNRSHDGNYHTCYSFVSDDELRYYM